MKPLKSQNFYEILDIPRHSTQEDIRRAFEICKTTYGDDSLATYSLFSEEENKEIFDMMAQAFETLRNPNSRQDYDVYLSSLEGDPERERAEGERMVASMIGLARTPADGPAVRTSPPGGKGEAPKPGAQDAQPGRTSGGEPPPGKTDPRYEKFLQSITRFSGPALKKIRGMKGMSIEDLADRTKIRITYLKYLEEENFEFLPAAVYIKGFVASVATALGLPAQQVAADYMEGFREKVPEN